MFQPQPKYSGNKSTPLEKGLAEIKQQIDKMLQMMRKKQEYVPERTDLEKYARQTLELVQKYHPSLSSQQKNLLAVIIDLTEIPVMHPTMQRVAFETALSEASRNLDEFFSR